MAVLLTALSSAHLALAASTPSLTSDTERATAGFFTLTWRGSRSAEYVLQESRARDFAGSTVVYRGSDTGHVISGYGDGDYYYRVRAAQRQSGWSEPVKVAVNHHPLSRALAFFGAGFAVFAATTAVILIGARHTRDS